MIHDANQVHVHLYDEFSQYVLFVVITQLLLFIQILYNSYTLHEFGTKFYLLFTIELFG
jgi:hypothetical protein